jgi:hypothetical protein
MALIYTKLTDKTTVLAPREGGCRKLNFGNDWTEIRMGMFASAVAATGSNNDNVNEIVVPAIITDYLTFGLKDDSQTYPGQAGSLFLGVRSHDATIVQSQGPSSGFVDSAGTWDATGYHDTTRVFNAATTGANGSMGGGTASAASAYANFMAIKIVIIDRGLSTQNVTVYTSFTTPVTGTDYSGPALRTAINNASYATGSNIAWNDGVTARAIPDCVWVRSPLYNNALRISAIRAIRYAP